MAFPSADAGLTRGEDAGRPAGGSALATALFFSLLFTGLAMSAAGAHVLELVNKLSLPRDEYIVVQQIYRGWALLGIVIVTALLATLAAVILAPGVLAPGQAGVSRRKCQGHRLTAPSLR